MFSVLLNRLIGTEAAYAVSPCAGVTGCNPSYNQIAAAIPGLASMALALAAGLSVMFVVIGGATMLLSGGNEGTATKGRNTVIFALVGYAVTLAAQPIISFVYFGAREIDLNNMDYAPFHFMGLVVRTMLSLFNAAFVIIIIVAGFRMVMGAGASTGFESGKKTVTWAVVGAVVVNLAYALVRATENLGFV